MHLMYKLGNDFLRRKGVSSKFIESLKEIYEGSKFRIRVNGLSPESRFVIP